MTGIDLARDRGKSITQIVEEQRGNTRTEWPQLTSSGHGIEDTEPAGKLAAIRNPEEPASKLVAVKYTPFRVVGSDLLWWDGCGKWHNLGQVKGEDGINGTNGSSTNGIDGSNGENGRGIKRSWIQGNDLYVEYTDDTKINLGKVVGADGLPGGNGITDFDEITREVLKRLPPIYPQWIDKDGNVISSLDGGVKLGYTMPLRIEVIQELIKREVARQNSK